MRAIDVRSNLATNLWALPSPWSHHRPSHLIQWTKGSSQVILVWKLSFDYLILSSRSMRPALPSLLCSSRRSSKIMFWIITASSDLIFILSTVQNWNAIKIILNQRYRMLKTLSAHFLTALTFLLNSTECLVYLSPNALTKILYSG